ncbi:flagellin domain-containing protein (plasmid) [Rhizobium etli 8C-3]|uniref:Flagellin n=1 Tax=Rhizobium etli 8C-3 TaxID=538025 RepID=A0A1L5PI99_RHIET|nr:flagellin [Rhizobium etli]APO79760.1 flagellin domain-containing protein [Rhizobium etli 8C-3]
MSSITTNVASIAALQTLRLLNSSLQTTEGVVSSGMRVETASDNAAYWSIATTMRSDRAAVSAVRNALDIGASVVDMSYEAMDHVKDVLSEMRAKLVTANDASVDKSKIQEEISQLAQSTVSIAAAASFNGVNWLTTNIHDLYEAIPSDRSAKLTSSFVRGADGTVSVGATMFDLINTSLFNSEGDGILQGDPRSPGTIGGIRPYENWLTPDIGNDYQPNYPIAGMPATLLQYIPYTVVGDDDVPTPIVFSNTDTITFDITIDGDDPSQGLAGPLNPGITTTGITIDYALVNSVAGASIDNATEMVAVLNAAFQAKGIDTLVSASRPMIHPSGAPPYPDPAHYEIMTLENSGLDGSQVQISNFSSTINVGSLGDANSYGILGSLIPLTFEPFKVFKDVVIDFTFGVSGEPTETHAIDRNTVNAILGTTDGWVNTADDMVTILKALITRPNTIIEANGSSILVRSDPLDDRLNGGKTDIGFTNMSVNVEPIPEMGVLDIDIEKYPGAVNSYLNSVDIMLARVTSGTAALGALKKRIDLQASHTETMIDAISSGVGRLVDADMEEESTRLGALQTQQQLALQSLSIVNSAPQALLSLFG